MDLGLVLFFKIFLSPMDSVFCFALFFKSTDPKRYII